MRVVKLAFDVAVQQPLAAHDVPFGWCLRPTNGAEVPTQMWMDVSGPALAEAGQDTAQTVGAALLNDGKYACDVRGSTMRLTILRCPPYAFHQPHTFGSKPRYDWIDQGSQEFTLRLCPHIGGWQDNDVVRRARELNMPFPLITTHAHAGELPRVASLLTLTSPEMEMTALKPAEDGAGYIIRLADSHGRGSQGALQWQGRSFPVSLAPFEVATLRLAHSGERWQLTPCDMLERPAG